MAVLNIKWGREKKTIEFPEQSLADIKLQSLRQRCHEWTGVPLGGLTLIYAGATMKDDSAPLSCFGIKPNGLITMMGTRPTKTDIRTLTTNGNPEEYALIVKIQTSHQKTLDLVAEHAPRYKEAVEAYIASNSPVSTETSTPTPTSTSTPTPSLKALEDAHSLLSENLLQAMLTLDGVTCQPDFEVARATRREAVKETILLMHDFDELNDRVKACARAASDSP
ncbi:hypothetical protein BGZ99_009879 [Dissophora globulifera]|uniref:Ubiquitin-like domain-containing protein n=1 Tax=Dissophora globulifera TaxID=979702 RepID=A0A9P6R7H4_9FUNG|nr:hypothetical protein BGZ99_009879 [Dissophora globulifera]